MLFLIQKIMVLRLVFMISRYVIEQIIIYKVVEILEIHMRINNTFIIIKIVGINSVEVMRSFLRYKNGKCTKWNLSDEIHMIRLI